MMKVRVNETATKLLVLVTTCEATFEMKSANSDRKPQIKKKKTSVVFQYKGHAWETDHPFWVRQKGYGHISKPYREKERGGGGGGGERQK